MKAGYIYKAKLARLPWFIKRFGLVEVVLKPLRQMISPIIIPLLPCNVFNLNGRVYENFYHAYNITWAGERMVEIPVIDDLVGRHPAGSVLEVGNVLSHYFPTAHQVIDKFEKGDRVTNLDILDYRPNRRFDLIVSISTFEHIGFDDDTSGSSGQKIAEAIRHCQRLLSPTGRLVITVPTGYNPELDNLLRLFSTSIKPPKIYCLERIGKLSWRQCDIAKALARGYNTKYPYANAVVFMEFSL